MIFKDQNSINNFTNYFKISINYFFIKKLYQSRIKNKVIN